MIQNADCTEILRANSLASVSTFTQLRFFEKIVTQFAWNVDDLGCELCHPRDGQQVEGLSFNIVKPIGDADWIGLDEVWIWS